jgi:hypothetical protein
VLRLLSLLVLALLVATAALAGGAAARDGRPEVRVAGTCNNGAHSTLRLRSRGGSIDVRLQVERGARGPWRVVLVQERRVVWKGAARALAPDGSFEIERTLRDLPGTDVVTVGAWGPRGAVCRSSATLPAA